MEFKEVIDLINYALGKTDQDPEKLFAYIGDMQKAGFPEGDIAKSLGVSVTYLKCLKYITRNRMAEEEES